MAKMVFGGASIIENLGPESCGAFSQFRNAGMKVRSAPVATSTVNSFAMANFSGKCRSNSSKQSLLHWILRMLPTIGRK